MTVGLNSDCCLGWIILKCNPLKPIYIRIVHPIQQHMKDYRSVQCTEADLGGLIDHEQHRKTRATLFIFSSSHMPMTVIMYHTKL
jgi:hypothetical protein